MSVSVCSSLPLLWKLRVGVVTEEMADAPAAHHQQSTHLLKRRSAFQTPPDYCIYSYEKRQPTRTSRELFSILLILFVALSRLRHQP